jgi:hypothetical protein
MVLENSTSGSLSLLLLLLLLLLLGAFAKLRKAPIRFVMFVCLSAGPSVRMEKLGSHWADFFMKFDISGFFENLSRKLKIN